MSDFSINNNNYNLRNRSEYRVPRCRLETYSKSFFPSTIRAWNSLDANIRSTQSSHAFKNTLKLDFLPVPSYYFIGNRNENIIHTKMRHRCSSLNADLFRANLINDSSCACGCPLEDAIHFFLECPLYLNSRVTLFRFIEPIVLPSIQNILFGNDSISDDQKAIIFKSVHTFIKHTKRFA